MTAPGWDEGAHQSALAPVGPHAARIEELWWVFFWGAAVILALVVVTALAATWRGRKRDDRTPVPRPPKDEERRLARVTGVAAGVTLVVLIALVGYSAATSRALADVPAADATPITIRGYQWWWQVEYPADPAGNTVTTANEIHVPVGRPVQLKLVAQDVIHSLWVPGLHGKQDLIPGRTTHIVWRAEEAGIYRGQCAEFCGAQHAHMALLVIAEPPDAFRRWLEAQRRPAKAPEDAQQREGQSVFFRAQCAACHSIDGADAHGTLGPNLTHIASRRTLAAATLPNTRGHLAGWILDSQAPKPGNYMPPTPLSPHELHALIAYLESLK